MSYQVIARKWRPQTFDEVTGQEHITQTLRNALEYDRLHHAYLFSGARGVGKTTTARLLAKALNCHKTDGKPNLTPCRIDDPEVCPSCLEISESRSMDVLEFDAASNTQVEKIRDIILEGINVKPARDRNKIFIIDEVHMLSTSSFNALLKTLEEPPANVIFVMATTEHHKVPETITSRCQEFTFRTISTEKIFERLRLIADAEKVAIDDAALREVARSGEGSMRDAQSNFDQVISFSGEKIAVTDVVSALGMASAEMLARTLVAIRDKQPREMLMIAEDLDSSGQDMRNFCRDLMSAVRDVSVFKITEDPSLVLGAAIPIDTLRQLVRAFSSSDLIRIFNSLADTEAKLKVAVQTRYTLEMGLVKLTEMGQLSSIESILGRLSALGPDNASETARPPSDEKAAAMTSSGPSEPAAQPMAPSATEEKKTLESEIPVKPRSSPDDWEDRDISQLLPPDVETVEQFDEVQSPASDPDAPPFVDLSFLEGVPARLSSMTSEDLAHFDDERLDSAYESALRAEGDDLRPIAGVIEIYRGLGLEKARAAAAVTSSSARDVSAYARPERDIDNEIVEIPTLSDNPTQAELVAFAQAHPDVRRVMRVFRASVAEVESRTSEHRLNS